MIEGSEQDTIQGIASHLTRASGRTEALAHVRTKFERNVLTLDEDGQVGNLGRIETVYGPD
jgi:hypothetical protein